MSSGINDVRGSDSAVEILANFPHDIIYIILAFWKFNYDLHENMVFPSIKLQIPFREPTELHKDFYNIATRHGNSELIAFILSNGHIPYEVAFRTLVKCFSMYNRRRVSEVILQLRPDITIAAILKWELYPFDRPNLALALQSTRMCRPPEFEIVFTHTMSTMFCNIETHATITISCLPIQNTRSLLFCMRSGQNTKTLDMLESALGKYSL